MQTERQLRSILRKYKQVDKSILRLRKILDPKGQVFDDDELKYIFIKSNHNLELAIIKGLEGLTDVDRELKRRLLLYNFYKGLAVAPDDVLELLHDVQ